MECVAAIVLQTTPSSAWAMWTSCEQPWSVPTRAGDSLWSWVRVAVTIAMLCFFPTLSTFRMPLPLPLPLAIARWLVCVTASTGVAGAGKEIATRPFQLVTGRVWKVRVGILTAHCCQCVVLGCWRFVNWAACGATPALHALPPFCHLCHTGHRLRWLAVSVGCAKACGQVHALPPTRPCLWNAISVRSVAGLHASQQTHWHVVHSCLREGTALPLPYCMMCDNYTAERVTCAHATVE